jgi:hypothetical protein
MKKNTSQIIQKKSKGMPRNNFIGALAIILIGVTIAWAATSFYSKKKGNQEEVKKINASIRVPAEAVPHNLVCMINNKYMGSPQIAVPISDKTYYGCCQNCVKELNENESARFAVDAFSKMKVDKASAFIIINPDTKEEILYFESEQNANKYLGK